MFLDVCRECLTDGSLYEIYSNSCVDSCPSEGQCVDGDINDCLTDIQPYVLSGAYEGLTTVCEQCLTLGFFYHEGNCYNTCPGLPDTCVSTGGSCPGMYMYVSKT